MRILFVADVPLANPTSGSEQVLNQQAIGLVREDMDVYAITRQAGPPSWVIRDIEGVREGSYQASAQDLIYSFFSLMRYPTEFYCRFTQNIPFHAAICHQPFNCFSLLIMRKLRDIPFFYVFHSPSHEEYNILQNKKRSHVITIPQIKAREIIEGFCIKRALRIVVLSEYMKSKVKQIHKIPGERIVVNPGGVDLEKFRPPQDPGMLKKGLGLPESKIHLLTVRNLEPRMGLDNLLKCIYILKTRQAGIHLVLGGEGPEKMNLENLIREYDLDDAVTMTGFIPSDRLPEYYGAADFFILPTRQLEGFGLVTVESMACGTPVLGTPVGGTKEILSKFDPRFLFKDSSPEAMAEGIDATINNNFTNKKKYDELRGQCRKYAERNYSWQRHVDQLMSIIDNAIRC